MQEELFRCIPNIDTVFRPGKYNPFIVRDVIKIRNVKFLSSFVLASVYNKKTYLGKCDTCPDMCGINNVKKI